MSTAAQIYPMQGSPRFEHIGTSVGLNGSWTRSLWTPSNLRYSMVTSLFYHCGFVFDLHYMVVEYLFFSSMVHVLRGDHNSCGVPA